MPGRGLTQKANDPTAALISFATQHFFTTRTYEQDGFAYRFALQPVIPITRPIPFFDRQIIRPTIPFLAPTADIRPIRAADVLRSRIDPGRLRSVLPVGPEIGRVALPPGGLSIDPSEQAGLGNITYLHIFAKDIGKRTIGPGFVAVLPTATNKLLGAREWALGPAIGLHR